VLQCNTLQQTCNTLQQTRISLQLSTTLCNTLQHSATPGMNAATRVLLLLRVC